MKFTVEALPAPDPAQAADSPALAAIRLITADRYRNTHPDNVEYMCDVASGPRTLLLGAVQDDGSVIGAALANRRPDSTYLSNVIVSPRHRELGVGRTLLRAVAADAVANADAAGPDPAVELHPSAGTAASGYYDELGFEPTGEGSLLRVAAHELLDRLVEKTAS